MSKRMAMPVMEMARARLAEAPLGIHAVKWEWKDGDVHKVSVGKCYAIPEQEIYAEEVCRFLNRELQEQRGSTWRVVWTAPKKSYYDRLSGLFRAWVPQALEMQYIDQDGDVQFVIDITQETRAKQVDVFTLLDNYSLTDIAQLCQQAYKEYYDLIAAAEVRANQMFSPNRGEVASAPDFDVNAVI